ncbi:hypothetical protein BDP27DRAFT_1395015 [Rhodocollybia butyracea]|uniref:Uncharacterized protein n=1 Tax=Rhodocollybia butyracea TaxID=206335 RepID=A0A9P5P7M0_9AGAR|nr:hypothetical protein BDP27DRAFT_1395015 [Rhodocollybia butyracea]
MHSKKSKAKGISESSWLDLKANLDKHAEQATLDRATGKSRPTIDGIERPLNDKKKSQWLRQNKGVKDRAARDVFEDLDPSVTEANRNIMKKKARQYRKLMQGKHGGINEQQRAELLVDFESKGISWESDSEDEDESLTVPVPPPNDEDDPIIEYVDELGRTRTSRRSEVPLEFLTKLEEQEEEEGVIRDMYDLQNHFPTYVPDADRQAKIIEQHSEENKPIETHYNPLGENRARGAASYNFSKDEESRRKEREGIDSLRDETLAQRQAAGAVDLRVGESEGMQAPETSAKSRALEKRKREREERMKKVEAQRKKAKVVEESLPHESATSSVTNTPPAIFAQPAAVVDPFAALEATTSKSGGPQSNQVDDFLASLGNELSNNKRRR